MPLLFQWMGGVRMLKWKVEAGRDLKRRALGCDRKTQRECNIHWQDPVNPHFGCHTVHPHLHLCNTASFDALLDQIYAGKPDCISCTGSSDLRCEYSDHFTVLVSLHLLLHPLGFHSFFVPSGEHFETTQQLRVWEGSEGWRAVRIHHL